MTAAQPIAPAAILRTGIILGIGLAMTIDEIVFHQILQWHNFYVHTSPFGRIVSDGLLHIVATVCFAVGIVRVWHQRVLPISGNSGQTIFAGVLLGMGGFNFYDGTIQHKLIDLHPIREGVANQLPYDLAWNGVALLLLLAGWLLWRRGATRDRA